MKKCSYFYSHFSNHLSNIYGDKSDKFILFMNEEKNLDKVNEKKEATYFKLIKYNFDNLI